MLTTLRPEPGTSEAGHHDTGLWPAPLTARRDGRMTDSRISTPYSGFPRPFNS